MLWQIASKIRVRKTEEEKINVKRVAYIITVSALLRGSSASDAVPGAGHSCCENTADRGMNTALNNTAGRLRREWGLSSFNDGQSHASDSTTKPVV